MSLLTKLTNPVVYIPAVYLLLALVVYDYWHAYDDVFAVGVALANNGVFVALVWVAVLCTVQLLWLTLVRAFFGTLSNTERDLMHNIRRVYGVPLIFCAYIMRSVALGPQFVYLLLSVVVYQLHKLAEERATSLGSPDSLLTRAWRVWQLAVFTQLATLTDYCVLNVLFSRRSTSHIHTMSEETEAWVRSVTLLLFVQCSFSVCVTQIRLAVYLCRGQDVADSVLSFYLESYTRIVEHAAVMACVAYIFVSLGIVPELLINFLYACSELTTHIVRLHNYYKLMRKISAFDAATPEALARELRCVICYEDMTDASMCKQLPCRHCYHVTCLQRWFRTNYTCPYCRADLLHYTAKATTTPPAPADVVAAAAEASDGGNDATAQPQQTPSPSAQPQRDAASAAAAVLDAAAHMRVRTVTITEDEIRAAYALRRQRATEEAAAAAAAATLPRDDADTAHSEVTSTLRGGDGVAARRLAAYEAYRRKIHDAECALQDELRRLQADDDKDEQQQQHLQRREGEHAGVGDDHAAVE